MVCLQGAATDGRSAAFDKDWKLLLSNLPEHELAPHLKPANFEVMVHVARDLSADFDFVRVDLYTVEDKVYFGELTCTPHQGYGAIANKERQKIRDKMWHLDAGNPLLYRPLKSHRTVRSTHLELRLPEAQAERFVSNKHAEE